MVLRADERVHIRIGTVLLGVAVKNGILQFLHRAGHVDLVATFLHRQHDVVKRLKDR